MTSIYNAALYGEREGEHDADGSDDDVGEPQEWVLAAQSRHEGR